MSWLPPLDSGGPPISQYRLYRANGTLPSPVTSSTPFQLLGFIPVLANASMDPMAAHRLAFNASSADPATLLLPMVPDTTYTLALTAESSLSEGLLVGSECVSGTTRPAIACPRACSGHGVCGSFLGLCTCAVGYALPDCANLLGIPVTLRVAVAVGGAAGAGSNNSTPNTTLLMQQMAALLRVPASRIILFTAPRALARRLGWQHHHQQQQSSSLQPQLDRALEAATSAGSLYYYTFDIIVTNGTATPSATSLVTALVGLAANGTTSYALNALGVVSVQPAGSTQAVAIPHVDCSLAVGAANNTCVVCVGSGRRQCGWCAQSSTCMQGGVLGPSGSSASTSSGSGTLCPAASLYVTTNVTSAPWAGSPPSTNVSIATVCGPDCPTLTSCSACAARPDCSWCQPGSVCVRAADAGAGRSAAAPSAASVCFAVPSPLPSASPSPGPLPAIPAVWITDPRVRCLG